jgi:hypothetical protein
MRFDTSHFEEKVWKAAGAVTEDRLSVAPESVPIIPTRNSNASRKEQVYLLDDILAHQCGAEAPD